MVLVSYIREQQHMPTHWALSPLVSLSIVVVLAFSLGTLKIVLKNQSIL